MHAVIASVEILPIVKIAGGVGPASVVVVSAFVASAPVVSVVMVIGVPRVIGRKGGIGDVAAAPAGVAVGDTGAEN